MVSNETESQKLINLFHYKVSYKIQKTDNKYKTSLLMKYEIQTTSHKLKIWSCNMHFELLIKKMSTEIIINTAKQK